MNGKIRVLGLCLPAVLAMSALAAIDATATVSGHFTHDALDGHAIVKGSGSGEHRLKLEVDGKTPTIECNVYSSEGTLSSATVTTIAVAPAFANCQTEGGSANSVTVDTNGCEFVYHSGGGSATFSLQCPAGEALVITDPSCEIVVPAQTVKGVTYGTAVSNPGNKHELTLSKSVTLSAQHEGGICVFLGTSHQLSITGSTTLAAFSTSGEQVNLTAT